MCPDLGFTCFQQLGNPNALLERAQEEIFNGDMIPTQQEVLRHSFSAWSLSWNAGAEQMITFSFTLYIHDLGTDMT